MKLVKEHLNEDHYGDPNDESSMARSQLKNIMKNAQSMLDLINQGQQLDAWVQSHLAVSNDKIQDAKNYLENEATEDPGAMQNEPQVIDPTMDAVQDFDGGYGFEDEEIIDEPAESPHAELLPPPFPEDEVETDADFSIGDGESTGDVNILDVETLYGDDETED